MPLPGVTVGEIRDALRAAFNKRDQLEMFLVVRLSASLDDMSGAGTTLERAAFDVVLWCEGEGRTTDLVRAAYAAKPAHPAVAAVYQKYGLATEAAIQQGGTAGGTMPVTAAGFEKTITDRLPQLKFGVWQERMAAVGGQVCRVEIGGAATGTGFLVGPDAVLTNYHVLEQVLAGNAPPGDVAFRFDYKELANGARLAGVAVRLHPTDWKRASSPYAPAERTRTPDAPPPTADELDYALVRLAERVGDQPVGGPEAPPRGWVALPAEPAAFPPDLPLMIAQHPDGAPLKLAVDTQSVVGVTAGGRRVRYRTNTEPGSSGSPVFDLGWNAVALHHLGDPAWDVPPTYNQGVPLHLIRQHAGAALGG